MDPTQKASPIRASSDAKNDLQSTYLVSPFYDDALNTVLQLAVTVLTYRKPTCQKEVLVIVCFRCHSKLFSQRKNHRGSFVPALPLRQEQQHPDDQ